MNRYTRGVCAILYIVGICKGDFISHYDTFARVAMSDGLAQHNNKYWQNVVFFFSFVVA